MLFAFAESSLEPAVEEPRKEGDGRDSTSGRANAAKFLTDENFRDRVFTNYRLIGTSTGSPPVITRTRSSTGVERLVGTVPR
jgi:hypothetical protein